MMAEDIVPDDQGQRIAGSMNQDDRLVLFSVCRRELSSADLCFFIYALVEGMQKS